MSDFLKEVGLDDDSLQELEQEFHEYFDEEEYYEDEYVEEEAADEEELTQEFDLLSVAKQKNKTKSQPQPKRKTAKPAATPAPKNNVQVRDIAELEYYHRLTKPSSKKSGVLNQIHFQLNVKECCKMAYEQIIPKFIVAKYSQEWLAAKLKLIRNLNDINAERRRKGQTISLTETAIDKEIVDEDTKMPIPKFDISMLASGESFLKRVNCAVTTHGTNIWIHGGTDGKSVFSDLIKYDTMKNTMTMFKDLHMPTVVANQADALTDVHTILPACSGHQMVTLGSTLVIFGGTCKPKNSVKFNTYRTGINSDRVSAQTPKANEMLVYWVSNITSEENMYIGFRKSYNDRVYFRNPARTATQQSFIPKLRDFTATVMNEASSMVFIFGGRAEVSSAGQNDWYLVTFNTPMTLYDTYTFTTAPPQASRPRGRYGHSAVAISGNVFIYGGQSHDSYLSDLHMYSFSSSKWQEISIDGSIPLPVSNHAAFAFGQLMYVYGGLHGKEDTDILYSYDTGREKWDIIKVMGHGSNALSSTTAQLQVPIHGHSCAVVGNKMFRIGGTHRGKPYASMASLTELQDQGTPILLCRYLAEKRQEKFLCDLKIRAKSAESDSIVELYAHSAIVHTRCDYLAKLIDEQYEMLQAQSAGAVTTSKQEEVYEPAHEVDEEEHEEELVFEPLEEEPSEETSTEDDLEQLAERKTITIEVPEEFTDAALDAYINFLYTGELFIKTGVQEFSKLVEKFSPTRHFPLISRICAGKAVFMDSSNIILKQLEDDFSKLINNAQSSDVILRLETGERIHSHRIILCRSQLFKSMFMSGMKESVAKVVTLEHHKDAVLEALKFMYTDRIEVSPQNCIGVLLYSSMLGLVELSNYCRNMVGLLLSSDNVFQVGFVAETYNDTPLRRMVLNFIVNNYTELSIRSEFEEMDAAFKHEASELHAKKMKHQRAKNQS